MLRKSNQRMLQKSNHKLLRSCIGCRSRDQQRNLVRIAAASGAVQVDFARRMPGRGGYLHLRPECFQGFLKAKVREFKSLKIAIAADRRQALVETLTGRLAP